MPIRPENRARYPKNWREIRTLIVERARHRCEVCGAVHGKPNPATGARVVLTVAHLDHTPENCSSANLKAMCQLCHNRYDAATRAAGRKARRRAGNLDLFPEEKEA